MPIQSKKNSEVNHLTIDDELTIYTAATLKEDLFGYLSDSKIIEIDLTSVSEIDSAGLQLLILLKREAIQINKTLTLINHSQAVLEVFELLDLTAHFGDPVIIPTEWHQ